MIPKLNSLRNFILFAIILNAGQLLAQYDIGYKETGKAAYYADKLRGRPTASGELYDKNAFTTAHKTLPFGTIIKVTNLSNNKTVTVKVNDRGPFQPGKMLDISRAAAEQIDLIKQGVAEVQLEVLGDDAITLPSTNNTTTSTQNNNTIDYNTPAVAMNEVASNGDNNINYQAVAQTQNTQQQTNNYNSLPETQPYNPPVTENKTRNIQNFPETSAITEESTLQANTSSMEIDEVGFVQRGKAGFYPADRNGKVTVTGEEYNMNDLVASHPNIQLNSVVKVTNLDNGKIVMVRVNDRPSADDLSNETIIKLSLKAAQTLGITDQKSADVKLEVMDTSNPIENVLTTNTETELPVTEEKVVEQKQVTLSAEEIVANRIKMLSEVIQPVNTYDLSGNVLNLDGFGIQVASYNDQLNAVEKALEFEKLQFKMVTIQAGWSNGQKSYRVLVGDFVSKEAAQPLMEFIKSKDLEPFLRKHIEAKNNN